MTTITEIFAMPGGPYNGTGIVGIVITSGVPSYFKVTGASLERIVSVDWFPKNPGSVIFDTRQLILVDNTLGTFMVRVLDNFLDTTDREGRISFRLDDGNVLTYPVKTFGRVSVGPLWTSPEQGINTG